MPYLDTITTAQDVRIAIWRLSETIDELIALWGKPEFPQRFLVAKAENRKREILATALLLRQKFGYDIELRHAPDGAPLIDEGNISISHTTTHVAIALHPTHRVGVDIETIGERAVRVASRVLSPEEMAWLPQEDITPAGNIPSRTVAIHIAWSVKEAVYKIHPSAVEFRRDIILSPIKALPTGSVRVHLIDSHTPIEAHYTLYNGCSLAWSIQ